MVKSAGKQGKNVGGKVPVIKTGEKEEKVVETIIVEKRTDPSDGNGPFELTSFIKFHGEEKGQELWDLGADSAVMVEKKIGGSKGAGKKKKNAAKPGQNNREGGNNQKNAVKAAKDLLAQADQMKKHAEKMLRAAQQQGEKKPNKKGTGKGNAKGGNKAGNQDQASQPAKEGVNKDSKSKKKGDGKNKGKGQSKGGAEKRIDPSDGNGPFTKASFIKFHGEEKGLELWNQSA